MLTTYFSLIREVAAFVRSTTVRLATLLTSSEAITQLLPQTRLVMSEPLIVLDAAWLPSLLVPIQLMPAWLASTLISALNTSLGVCPPPLVETLSRSILTGSLAAGRVNVWLPPGATTKVSRWWSGPRTMTDVLGLAAWPAPPAPATATTVAATTMARRPRIFPRMFAPLSAGGPGLSRDRRSSVGASGRPLDAAPRHPVAKWPARGQRPRPAMS